MVAKLAVPIAKSLESAIKIIAGMVKKNNKRVSRAELNKISTDLTPADSKLLDEQLSAGLNKVPKNKTTAADNIKKTRLGGADIGAGAKAKMKADAAEGFAETGLAAEREQQAVVNKITMSNRNKKDTDERLTRQAAERAKDKKLAEQIKREDLAAKRNAKKNMMRGGMATKSNKGHTDYRKGGLVLSSMDNRKKKK